MTEFENITRVILGCAEKRLTQGERDLFTSNPPFGFILFARNIENPAQLHALTDDLRSCTHADVPIFIDQEGGRVARMRGQGWFSSSPALDHAGHPQFERLFYLRGRLIAEDLFTCGINANCAPLLDVAHSSTHAVLKNRCYGFDAASVTLAAQALIAGQSDGGVYSVIKHIPGHGRAELDSHLDLPVVNADAETLQNIDFRAFKACANTPFAMSAHIIYTAFDAQRPATQSSIMIDIIRNQIGFSGVLMSDDISMNALRGDVVTRSRAALAAGCDVVLHCNGDMGEMRALCNDLPQFTGMAQKRAQIALSQKPMRQNIDISALRSEFDTLINES